MNTFPVSTRLPECLIKFLDNYAKEHKWSRNFTIKELLTQKMYELSGDVG